MTKSYCDLFPPGRTDDSETIILGYIVGRLITREMRGFNPHIGQNHKTPETEEANA